MPRVVTDRSDMGRRSRAALADEDESHSEVNESAAFGRRFAYERIAVKFASGGVLPINSGLVVPFNSSDGRRRSLATPSQCGNVHPLTAANLATTGARWRWRQCWAARARAWRLRRNAVA